MSCSAVEPGQPGTRAAAAATRLSKASTSQCTSIASVPCYSPAPFSCPHALAWHRKVLAADCMGSEAASQSPGPACRWTTWRTLRLCTVRAWELLSCPMPNQAAPLSSLCGGPHVCTWQMQEPCCCMAGIGLTAAIYTISDPDWALITISFCGMPVRQPCGPCMGKAPHGAPIPPPGVTSAKLSSAPASAPAGSHHDQAQDGNEG